MFAVPETTLLSRLSLRRDNEIKDIKTNRFIVPKAYLFTLGNKKPKIKTKNKYMQGDDQFDVTLLYGRERCVCVCVWQHCVCFFFSLSCVFDLQVKVDNADDDGGDDDGQTHPAAPQ